LPPSAKLAYVVLLTVPDGRDDQGRPDGRVTVNGTKYTAEDLADDAGLSPADADDALRSLENQGLVEWDGDVLLLVGYADEQEAASTGRVRKHRKRTRAVLEEDPRYGNADETLVKQHRNGDATGDVEGEAEAEEEGDSEGEEKTGIGRAGPKRMTPPALVQVEKYATEYMASKCLTGPDPAERFHNHYSANGWKMSGGVPMKDWKAALRNWIGRDLQDGRLRPAHPKDDDEWVLDLYRRTDQKTHSHEPDWQTYIEWTGEQPPRTAMTYTDWKAKQATIKQTESMTIAEMPS